MYIISGKYKGRKLITLRNDGFRPTTSKTREAVFNILTNGQFIGEDGVSVLEEAIVLDVCCGIGSLACEAISRGAKSVILVDQDPKRLHIAYENTTKLIGEQKVTALKQDATNIMSAKYPVDIVFIDPPYNSNIIPKIVLSLDSKKWLKQGAILVIECCEYEKFSLNDNFEELVVRNYGKAKISIFRRK